MQFLPLSRGNRDKPTLVYRLLRKLPSTSEETEKIVKNYILIWSSRISDAPALKCIVNRWAESVVMVKPVPVLYLAKKTSICVVWELLSKNFIVVIKIIDTRGT